MRSRLILGVLVFVTTVASQARSATAYLQLEGYVADGIFSLQSKLHRLKMLPSMTKHLNPSFQDQFTDIIVNQIPTSMPLNPRAGHNNLYIGYCEETSNVQYSVTLSSDSGGFLRNGDYSVPYTISFDNGTPAYPPHRSEPVAVKLGSAGSNISTILFSSAPDPEAPNGTYSDLLIFEIQPL